MATLMEVLNKITNKANETFERTATKVNFEEWLICWMRAAEEARDLAKKEGLTNTAAAIQSVIDIKSTLLAKARKENQK